MAALHTRNYFPKFRILPPCKGDQSNNQNVRQYRGEEETGYGEDMYKRVHLHY